VLEVGEAGRVPDRLAEGSPEREHEAEEGEDAHRPASEVALSRTPASRGPSGAARSEIVRAALSTRPISRSGVIAVR
jgi:hypothetical protein